MTTNLTPEALATIVAVINALQSTPAPQPAAPAPQPAEDAVIVTVNGQPFTMSRVAAFKSSGNAGYSLQTRVVINERPHALMFALSEIKSAPAEVREVKKAEAAERRQLAAAAMRVTIPK